MWSIFPMRSPRCMSRPHNLMILNHMDNNQYCVIMAGGHGGRFWPLTREDRPKQFLEIGGGGRTLMRLTYERFSKIFPTERIIVVTLSRYESLVKECIPELSEENLLIEPYSRGTAPCIAYATYELLRRDPEAVMTVTPADQIIMDEEVFCDTVRNIAGHAVSTGTLVTIGVVPDRPDTNFGYIQIAGGKKNKSVPMKVKTFTEKPDTTLATIFCKSGEFYWNSGIFACRAKVMEEEMNRYIPEVTSLFKGWETALVQSQRLEFLEKVYSSCSNLSIDYGVMEKTDRAWLYPAKFGWSDIDSWESLYKVMPEKDEDANFSNAGKTLMEQNHHCLIWAKNKKKVLAVMGLQNYAVIDTDDVLLICPLDSAEIKDLTAGVAMPDFEDYR